MKILLSIKPEFVCKIFDGSKRYEYRKILHQRANVKMVVIYATQPVAKIVGEFEISHIVSGSPPEVWRKTSRYAGITHDFFSKYFDGRKRAYAFAIGDVRRYAKPIPPEEIFTKFTPPQSFIYVDVSPLENFQIDRQMSGLNSTEVRQELDAQKFAGVGA
jgi:predicted transcriptional regulator